MDGIVSCSLESLREKPPNELHTQNIIILLFFPITLLEALYIVGCGA
jgi:hypothetical protein